MLLPANVRLIFGKSSNPGSADFPVRFVESTGGLESPHYLNNPCFSANLPTLPLFQFFLKINFFPPLNCILLLLTAN
jgi:hypothetical protein